MNGNHSTGASDETSVEPRYFPDAGFLRARPKGTLLADLIAGATVCLVSIPTVIAYAGLIGLPPQFGLYATLLPLAIYPFFRGARKVMVGPDIAICLLMASAIRPLAGSDQAHAAVLASTIAIFSGILLVLGACAKIGAVADFFSKPVLVGYMTGAALILVASQLDKLFGITLHRTEFFARLGELCGNLSQTNGPTLVLGIALIILALGLRRFTPKIPAAFAVCVLAIMVSALLHLERHGVATVGLVPAGLPRFSFPHFNLVEIQALLPACIGIALLSYTEGILLARAFAAKDGEEVNPNQELIALGMSDIVTGLFQGFPGTGSQARTAINNDAGGKTPIASLCAAAMLAIFLLFLTPLVAHLPMVALAAVLILGGFNLIEFAAMKRIYRYYPGSAALAAATTLGVLAAGVIPGILLGVVLSLLALIRRISHPPDAVLQDVPGHGFHDLGVGVQGKTLPGLLIYRFYAPLLFSNAAHFAQRVRGLIRESPTPVVWFLLDAQAITDIDVTAAEMLHALHQELQREGIELKIAHANWPLRSILEKTGLASEINPGSFFASVHECVQAYQAHVAGKTE